MEVLLGVLFCLLFLCSPSCPVLAVDQDGLELLEIHLRLLPEC